MPSASIVRGGPVPEGPVDLETALRVFPTVRQSLLASFDDCELSTLFQLRYANGWSTHPQARGQIFHRVAAECLRVMREQDSEGIPAGVALAILEEKCYQWEEAPEDIVRVPLRELPVLEMAVRKFAQDNTFSVRNIIDVERRLSAVLTYPDRHGQPVQRTLTGQLDALIARPPDEAVVIDWKDTWALPPDRHEDAEDPGISYHGYFQQQFYAWLVMMNYPAVNAVSLREFYARRTKARSARVTRQDLPKVEQRLRYLVASFDRAVMAGEPRAYDIDGHHYAPLSIPALEQHGSWKPSPGKHCGWCAKAHLCPIDEDYRGSVTTPEKASLVAAVRQKAMAVAKNCKRVLDPWVEEHGPVDVKWSKGRRVYGPRTLTGGKVRIEEYTPTDADRPSTMVVENPNLVAAMKSATERAREARDDAGGA